MAEQTTSSITVDAPASAVMDVIADFDAYPQWAKGVTKAETRASYDDGRAKEVFFMLDVSPIKDEYTLVLPVGRRPRGHLDPGRGQDAPCPRRRLRAAGSSAAARPT